MKFPSKVTPFKASIIAKFPLVLSCLETEDLKPDSLYKKVKTSISDVGEFLEILDCLYALGTVVLLQEGGLLHYVN